MSKSSGTQTASKTKFKLSPVPKKGKKSTASQHLNGSKQEATAPKENAKNVVSKSLTTSPAKSKVKLQHPKIKGGRKATESKQKENASNRNSRTDEKHASNLAVPVSPQKDESASFKKIDKNAANTEKQNIFTNKLKTPSKGGGTTALNLNSPVRSKKSDNINESHTVSHASEANASVNKETIQPTKSNNASSPKSTPDTSQKSMLKSVKFSQSAGSGEPNSAKVKDDLSHDRSPSVASPNSQTERNQNEDKNNATNTSLDKASSQDKHSAKIYSQQLTEAAKPGTTQKTSKPLDEKTNEQPETSKSQHSGAKTEKAPEHDDSENEEPPEKSPTVVIPKKKPTLLNMAMAYRSQNAQKFKEEQNQKRYFFDANDNCEDPFLAAYYQSQEEEYHKEKQEQILAKKESPHIFAEVTFNHALNKNEQNQGKQDAATKQSENKTGPQKQTKADDKGKLGKATYVKYLRLTYKSLDADGVSIFDNEDTSSEKDPDAKDEVRGLKPEMIIRIKKGLYLNNWLEKNGIENCQLSYVKCHLFDKPGMLQKPRKQHSTNCFISKTGKTYWDHAFILRGFTIKELAQIYVIINVKGKYRERYQDAEQDETTPTTPHDFVHQKRGQLVHAIKRRNISLGKFVLAGEEAKIFPTAASMYRDPTKEEINAWKEACAQPGVTQKLNHRLLPRNEGVGPLTLLPNSPSPSSKTRHRWHSVLTLSKKSSPSSSISS